MGELYFDYFRLALIHPEKLIRPRRAWFPRLRRDTGDVNAFFFVPICRVRCVIFAFRLCALVGSEFNLFDNGRRAVVSNRNCLLAHVRFSITIRPPCSSTLPGPKGTSIRLCDRWPRCAKATLF